MTKLYIYENDLGQFVLVTGPLATDEYTYNTYMEAMKVANKLETARAIVRSVQALADSTDTAGDRFQEYWDLVNSGETFTDDDLVALGINTVELGNCINLLQAFDQFMSGEAHTVTTYRTTLNRVRRL